MAELTGAVLYHGEPNGASLTVLAALAESGLEVTCKRIDLLKGERHSLPGVTEAVALDNGIEGEGPVLVIDGEAMTESVFLAQFFDDAAGGVGMQPSDPYRHWEMMMWCRQMTERLSPAAALLGTMAHAQQALHDMDAGAFDAVVASIAAPDLKARWQALRDGAIDPGAVSDSHGKVDAAVLRCEKQLDDGRDWLMGDFSIADLVTFAWLAGMQGLRANAFADAPKTEAWIERVRARPSVQAALARGAGGDPLASWAPGPEINRWG